MDKRQQYFDSFADEWDKMFTAEDLEILDFLINSFDIREDFKVADLGCGTGVQFDMLRRKVGPGGLVVGIDFSSRMLHKAKLNFPFSNIIAIDGDVESLPLKGDHFDMAISFAAFAHFPHPKLVIQEASRILKKGGSFHIIHLMSSKELERHHLRAGGPVAHDHIPTSEQMKGLLESNNFTGIVVTDHPGLYLANAIKG
jgi:ubiquinone/menaquinone biosynthesis C-methylase UbiE